MKLISAATLAAGAYGISEVLILFDASHSGVIGAAVHTHLTEAWSALRQEFPEASFAVASFIDKPAPFVGLGVYGGYPNGRRVDWCYRLETPLTNDDEVAKDALLNIPTGSGLDAPEGHFEAIIRGAIDSQIGWSESGSKAIVIFTDDYGHLGNLNSLAQHVDLFSEPVRCDPSNNSTAGGFGAQTTYAELAGWVTADYDAGVPYSTYYEMANLLSQHMCQSEELTVDQLVRLEQLREQLGPVEVPSVKPFNLDVMMNDPDTHCREHEYPIFEDIIQVLNQRNISLVVVQVDATAARASTEDIWVYTLTDPLKDIPNQYRHIQVSSPQAVSDAVIIWMLRSEVISDGTRRYLTRQLTDQVLIEALNNCEVATVSDLIALRQPTSLSPSEIRHLDNQNPVRNLLKQAQHSADNMTFDNLDEGHQQLQGLARMKLCIRGSQSQRKFVLGQQLQRDPRDNQVIVTDNFWTKSELNNLLTALQETLKVVIHEEVY